MQTWVDDFQSMLCLPIRHTAANQAAAISLHVAASACRQDGCNAHVLLQAISDLCLLSQASQSALRNLNAKLRALYNLGASLIAWLANPFSGGPYWCHFPSGFAEWAVSIYAILTVWCIMVCNTLAKCFEWPAGDDPCNDYVGCHAQSVLLRDVCFGNMIADDGWMPAKTSLSSRKAPCSTMSTADSGCQACPFTPDVQPNCDALDCHFSCCDSLTTIFKQVPAQPACKEVHSR